jgi:hypothetical protein
MGACVLSRPSHLKIPQNKSRYKEDLPEWVSLDLMFWWYVTVNLKTFNMIPENVGIGLKQSYQVNMKKKNNLLLVTFWNNNRRIKKKDFITQSKPYVAKDIMLHKVS